MSVEIRREMLVRYLREHGRTAVNDLATHFNITGATVRSDLRQLEQSNLVTRRYGGAEAVTQPVAEDRTMDEKTTLNQNIKQRIGAKAAGLVHDGESIILDNGSTTLQMVPWLVERVALTLMTNSLLIMNEVVSRDSNMTLLMPGGTYRKRSSSFHGGLAEQAFRSFTFDKLFIGADGFDIEQGTTTFNEAYQVSQAMCQAAKQIIVVTDSTKFGRKTPNVVVPISKIDIVITDQGISESDKAALEQRGIQVLLV
ncbi:glucitol operon DNA-binding transcriptional repressor SrlR [Tolumonas lignilytica]|jgi:Transcriptional regulators of sugar metabolism|uniref:glucitol operon DNA-binding transcriptional repressor SrlR n=1 Tax=Tolumonas lignilytica TaxID=1283284 RepID=UPI00046758D4|nr:DNA-binding transcriptional repressor [Tolumonas lignilytica]